VRGEIIRESAKFNFHMLDLRPDLDSLYRGLHKSCVRRKIQRAEQENLGYEEGRAESILAKFYRLLLLTRRRHQLPPQPVGWFRNLLHCLGDRASIHMVSKDGQPIASILTLLYKHTLVYKYGCSDSRFHSLGGMPLLFWKAIQEGKRLGPENSILAARILIILAWRLSRGIWALPVPRSLISAIRPECRQAPLPFGK